MAGEAGPDGAMAESAGTLQPRRHQPDTREGPQAGVIFTLKAHCPHRLPLGSKEGWMDRGSQASERRPHLQELCPGPG